MGPNPHPGSNVIAREEPCVNLRRFASSTKTGAQNVLKALLLSTAQHLACEWQRVATCVKEARVNHEQFLCVKSCIGCIPEKGIHKQSGAIW